MLVEPVVPVPMVVVAPGTVVPVPGSVVVGDPVASGTVVGPGSAPSPEPLRKKNAMRNTATRAMISVRSRAWAGVDGWRCRAVTDR